MLFVVLNVLLHQLSIFHAKQRKLCHFRRTINTIDGLYSIRLVGYNILCNCSCREHTTGENTGYPTHQCM